MNPFLDFTLVRDHPSSEEFSDRGEWKWDWKELSGNKSLDWSLVRDYSDKDWDWWKLSKNPSLDPILFELDSPELQPSLFMKFTETSKYF